MLVPRAFASAAMDMIEGKSVMNLRAPLVTVLITLIGGSVPAAWASGMNAKDSFLDIAADSDFDTNTISWFIMLKPSDAVGVPSQGILATSYDDIDGDGTPENNFAAAHLWGNFLENGTIRSYSRSSSGSIRAPSAPNVTEQWTLVSAVWDGEAPNDSMSHWLNGSGNAVNGATATPLGHQQTRIGAHPNGSSRSFDGDIAEILIYNAALDNSARQAVEAYLFNKWVFDVPASLSVTTDLLVWLKADAGVVPDDGNGRFVWLDQSLVGGANDAVQTRDWQKPELVPNGSFNGDLPVLRFGEHFDTAAALSDALLKITPEQQTQLDDGAALGLIELSPVHLPDEFNYIGNCWHFGWPVATIVDGVILVLFHRTPQHFAGIRDASNNCKTKTLVMRSTDGGVTWTGPIDLADVVVTPTQSVQMIFGKAIGTTAVGQVFVVSTLGVFRSDDAGLTWTHLPGAFSATQLPTDNLFNGPRILEHPTFGLVVASHREQGVNPDGTPRPADRVWLRYSTDGGWTWQETSQALPGNIQPVEPALLMHNGNLFLHARAHGSFDAATKTYRYAQMTSQTGWLPLTPALTNMRTTDRRDDNGVPAFQGPWSQDTSAMDFNPVTGRVEVVVTNREGLGFGQEDVRRDVTEMTLNLFSIDPNDLAAGSAEWQFEGTLLRRFGTHASGDQDDGSHSDGMHPGAAVIDEARGVQHIFVYIGNPQGPAGIYRITRTLDTPALRRFLGPRPATAAEPMAWFMADQGVELDGGGFVTRWVDQWSRDGDHSATQGDPNSQPLLVADAAPNGHKPALALDGVDDFLDIAASADFETDQATWFAVFRTATPSVLQQLLVNAYTSMNGITHPNNYATNHLWGTFLEFSRYRSHARDVSGAIKTPFPPGNASTDWVMLTGAWQADNNVRQWTNGGYDGARSGATAIPTGHKGTRIGADPVDASAAFNGEIAELIIFDRELPDADRVAIETYLQQKWFPVAGDLNGDGVLTAIDAWLQLGCMTGPDRHWTFSGCGLDEFTHADWDGDNDVDLIDVSAVSELIGVE